MKLTSLKLENFRCFRKADFDLTADVVAIYGRNGVGKTAVFDAIEFALLGSIARYSKQASPPDYLPCRFGNGGVLVRVGFGDTTSHWLEMKRAKDTQANWQLCGSGGWNTNADFLFDFMLDPELSPARRETDTAADYIRSTLILSQHSIRKLVEAEAAKRTPTLAFLAGAGAVQRRLEKAEAVLAEAKRAERREGQNTDEAKRVAEELAQRFAEQEGRITAIRKQLVTQGITRESFRKALQDAGFPAILPPNAEEADLFSARISGLCSERIMLCEAKLSLLAEVGAMSELHASRVEQNRQLLVDIANSKTRQQALLAEENAIATKSQALEREIGDLEPLLSKQKATINSLTSLHTLLSTETELAKTLAIAEQTQQALNGEVKAMQNVFEHLDVDLKSIPANNVACYERAERSLAELLSLNHLVQEVQGFHSLVKSALDQTVRMHFLEDAIRALLPIKTAFEIQLSAAEQRAGELNRRVAGAKTLAEGVAGLAARLRQHVISKECPLCGHAHSSISDLQRAIDKQLSQVPEDLKKASSDLEALVKEKSQLIALVEDNKKRLEELHVSSQDAREQREHALRTIGAALEQKSRAVADTKQAIQAVQSQIAALRTEGLQQPLQVDVGEKIRAERSELAIMEARAAAASAAREGIHNQQSSIRNERLSVEQSLGEWQDLVGRLTVHIQHYRTKCRQLGLAEDASVDVLSLARRRASEELSLLQSVQQNANGYALSGKSAAIEKECVQTQAQLEEARKTLARFTEKRYSLEVASKEVEGWIKLLSEQVNRAVTDRITAHKGEINSLFKAMIPAPYLFEEIAMKQEENGLRLGLRYRAQEEDVGEPQFYLSNAQANVLALSMFLSFTRAQRWAKLETILLDDPVQHLDDLDAVAFLDTLRSVALGGLGPRKQVVVSTCDQNLYLLMIRKFGMLESMGLRFTGISLLDRGESGPEIIYDIGGPSGRTYLREAV